MDIPIITFITGEKAEVHYDKIVFYEGKRYRQLGLLLDDKVMAIEEINKDKLKYKLSPYLDQETALFMRRYPDECIIKLSDTYNNFWATCGFDGIKRDMNEYTDVFIFQKILRENENLKAINDILNRTIETMKDEISKLGSTYKRWINEGIGGALIKEIKDMFEKFARMLSTKPKVEV